MQRTIALRGLLPNNIGGCLGDLEGSTPACEEKLRGVECHIERALVQATADLRDKARGLGEVDQSGAVGRRQPAAGANHRDRPEQHRTLHRCSLP